MLDIFPIITVLAQQEMLATIAIWTISTFTALGVVFRPFRFPEFVFALSGAFALIVFQLISAQDAWNGLQRGTDVYLFLTGMMLLSEVARREGLFDWLAFFALSHAKGSPKRLFLLIYIVGVVVTAFLSNDATAVVLTPAVYAACRAAKISNPMPFLLVCAFTANAASFVLPISNPANLVVFGAGTMPSLWLWIATFSLPSIGAILATFLALYWTQRPAILNETLQIHQSELKLSLNGKLAAAGLCVTSFVLLCSSAFHFDLGLPTFITGFVTMMTVLLLTKNSLSGVFKNVAWSVLPLVGGLFIVVEALENTNLTSVIAEQLSHASLAWPDHAAALSGLAVALISNMVNNLPAGLLAGSVVQVANVPDKVAAAILIGVDLGPNLSITGSLATILWLSALRREGVGIGAIAFFKLGTVVMFPALLLSLTVLIIAS